MEHLEICNNSFKEGSLMRVYAWENRVFVPSAEVQVVCVTGLVGSVFICGLECQRTANLRILLSSLP